MRVIIVKKKYGYSCLIVNYLLNKGGFIVTKVYNNRLPLFKELIASRVFYYG